MRANFYYRALLFTVIIFCGSFRYIKAESATLDSLQQVLLSTTSSSEKANTLLQIGQVQVKEMDPHGAIGNFQEAIAVFKLIEDDNGLSQALYALAKAQAGMENCEGALENYNMAIEYSIRNNDKQLEMDGYFSAADCYTSLSKPLFAIEYYTQGLRLANEFQTGRLIYEAYKGLSESHATLGNFEKALKYKNRYVAVHDSLNEIKQREYEEKLAREQVQSDKIKKLEDELQTSQKTSAKILNILLISGLVILVLLIAIVLIRALYNRKAAAKQLSTSNVMSREPGTPKPAPVVEERPTEVKTSAPNPDLATGRNPNNKPVSFSWNVPKKEEVKPEPKIKPAPKKGGTSKKK